MIYVHILQHKLLYRILHLLTCVNNTACNVGMCCGIALTGKINCCSFGWVGEASGGTPSERNVSSVIWDANKATLSRINLLKKKKKASVHCKKWNMKIHKNNSGCYLTLEYLSWRGGPSWLREREGGEPQCGSTHCVLPTRPANWLRGISVAGPHTGTATSLFQPLLLPLERKWEGSYGYCHYCCWLGK